MPPQPLSSKHVSGAVTLNPVSVKERPELAAKIAQIIAIWARIESLLATILARVLVTQVRPSMAMYEAIHNTQIQMAVLTAAANTTLSGEVLEIFSALMIVVKQSANNRHKVAHWLWGISPEFPDCLILADPAAVREQDKIMSEVISALEHDGPITSAPILDFSRVFLWETRDFDEIIAELEETHRLMHRFSALIITRASASLDSRLKGELLNAPRIQTALQKLRKSTPGTP